MVRHQQSDPENWVDTYGDDLFRYAMFRLRDPELAEDVVQETFLSALQARKQFLGQSSERTWLYGILKHKIVDSIRKASRELPLEVSELPKEAAEDFFDDVGKWRDEPADWGADPSKDLERKEFKKVFERCLANLPSRLGDAFSLRELDGLSSKEVCKVLRISATNLWVMLYRARIQLRHCLEMSWFDLKKARNH